MMASTVLVYSKHDERFYQHHDEKCYDDYHQQHSNGNYNRYHEDQGYCNFVMMKTITCIMIMAGFPGKERTLRTSRS